MWTSNSGLFFPNPFLAPSSLAGWGLLLAAAGCLRLIATQQPVRRPILWLWWGLLGGVLVAFRWPVISLPHEIYPDETQLLAGAITLRHDPVFWRSVDGGTAGPLDYYALLPAACFSGATGYAIARLTATLLVWGMLVAAGETIALIGKRPIARIAILPALLFEALNHSAEFLHYSTELLPSLLLALSVLILVRQSLRPARWHLWVGALLLGAVPFAKLQAAPIAAGLGLLFVGMEFASGRKNNILPLIIAALLPALLAAALVTVTGETENLIIPYFLQNTYYASSGRLPLSVVVRQLGEQSLQNGYHLLWFTGSVLFCLAVGVCAARKASVPLRSYGLAVIALLALTLCCILTPGRPYHHYLNFLTLPLVLLTGIALCLALESTAGGPGKNWRLPISLFLLCGVLPPLAWCAVQRPDPYDDYYTIISTPRPGQRELLAAVKNLSVAGEAIGVWGWRSSLYVEAGLWQATRQAQSEAQFVPGRWQPYFLRRYYEDMVASAPPVFADAAGPGNFWFSHRSMGHERFPLLREWIDAQYAYVGEWDGVRLYARRDRVPPAPVR